MRFVVYSWPIVLGLIAVALLVEQAYQRGRLAWLLLVGACLAGALSILGYESAFPLLVTAPGLIWLARRKLSWRFIVTSGLWYAAIVAAFALFLIPYLQGSPTTEYQQHFTRATSLGAFIQSARTFYDYSFPLDTIAHDVGALVSGNYLTTALLIGAVAGLCIAIFWRLGVSEAKPLSLKKLLGYVFVGLVLTGIGGFAYIDIDYLPERSVYFSAPAQ